MIYTGLNKILLKLISSVLLGVQNHIYGFYICWTSVNFGDKLALAAYTAALPDVFFYDRYNIWFIQKVERENTEIKS